MLELLASYANGIGLVGVVLTLIGYYLLNINKISSTDMSYLWLNLIGSSLVLVSLWFYWNLSSVIIEAAWVLISLIGIYRTVKANK